MGYKCCVPGCRSNYDKENTKYSCFSFPKDKQLREKWLSAIPRKDFSPTEYTKVRLLVFFKIVILLACYTFIVYV